jgi:hypothetical protein
VRPAKFFLEMAEPSQIQLQLKTFIKTVGCRMIEISGTAYGKLRFIATQQIKRTVFHHKKRPAEADRSVEIFRSD